MGEKMNPLEIIKKKAQIAKDQDEAVQMNRDFDHDAANKENVDRDHDAAIKEDVNRDHEKALVENEEFDKKKEGAKLEALNTKMTEAEADRQGTEVALQQAMKDLADAGITEQQMDDETRQALSQLAEQKQAAEERLATLQMQMKELQSKLPKQEKAEDSESRVEDKSKKVELSPEMARKITEAEAKQKKCVEKLLDAKWNESSAEYELRDAEARVRLSDEEMRKIMQSSAYVEKRQRYHELGQEVSKWKGRVHELGGRQRASNENGYSVYEVSDPKKQAGLNEATRAVNGYSEQLGKLDFEMSAMIDPALTDPGVRAAKKKVQEIADYQVKPAREPYLQAVEAEARVKTESEYQMAGKDFDEKEAHARIDQIKEEIAKEHFLNGLKGV